VLRRTDFRDRARTLIKQRREDYKNRVDRLYLRIHTPLERKVRAERGALVADNAPLHMSCTEPSVTTTVLSVRRPTGSGVLPAGAVRVP
jgi:hypothetical protein